MNVGPGWRIGSVVAMVVGLWPAVAGAQLQLQPYVSGFSQPTGMVQDPSDPTVQYVLEKGGPGEPTGTGRIRVIKNAVKLTTSFLELTVQTTSECGVLGLAFPADYATSGRFYVYHCLPQGNGDVAISRFKRSTGDPLVADMSTRLDFLFPAMGTEPSHRYIKEPFQNHKGGKMVFGPDGYLYVAVGDGGDGGDPQNNAQKTNTLLGKILRLDVNVGDPDTKGYAIPPTNPFVGQGSVLGEIWDLGVRNPWKFSFDDPTRGGTGALVIGDVGQGAYEEVDYEPAGKGGRNYGWAIREGFHAYGNPADHPQGPGALKDPIYEYDHGFGNSITGGYVYRGSLLPATYRGRYFLGDFGTRKVVSLGLTLDMNGEAGAVPPANVIDHTSGIGPTANWSSIDIDSQGELYFVGFNGTIYKLVDIGDTDHDGLPNTWEAQFGFDPNSTGGDNGATGDPDHDGKSNLQEFQAGTHPRNNAAFTRYFAEGATGFFGMTIALANAGDTSAIVNLQFLRDDGTVTSTALTILPHRRATVNPATVSGLTAAAFSTVIESDHEIVAERTMVWPTDVRYGSHTETAVKSPATTWYLAEGSTLGDFSLYYLLENPNPTPTTVDITYLLPAPAAPITKPYTIPANTRKTIAVQDEPGLADTDVSGVINVVGSTNGIIVERAMYLSGGGQLWRLGHDAAGVTGLSTHWFFAEGATGGFFDMFVLLANPGDTPADVTLTFLQPDGTSPISVHQTVEPHSRKTVNPEGLDPALANTAISTVIQSTQPIVAERAMYWPNPWIEGAASPGATDTGLDWVVADGERGGAYATETFVLIANTSSFAGVARVTLLMEDGTVVAPVDVTLPPNSRINAPDFAAETNGKRYSVLIQSLGSTPAEIVVERATYSNDSNGVFWSAGGSAFGTKIR